MKLAPLRQLLMWMIAAVSARAIVAFASEAPIAWNGPSTQPLLLTLLALRWLAGLLGVLALGLMAWQTLKIPNTQSATGILYVAVIFVFLGELAAQVLSASVHVGT
jgi:hypothetical protein